MVNINDIYIVMFDELTSYEEDTFDFEFFNDDFEILGLTLKSRLSDIKKTSEYCEVIYFKLLEFTDSVVDSKEVILDYLGFNYSVDTILDIINETKDKNRIFYLKSILNYKTQQEDKPVFKDTYFVEHFDDFINEYGYDFLGYEILGNNEDYSVTEVVLKSCLEKEEIKNKYKKYIKK